MCERIYACKSSSAISAHVFEVGQDIAVVAFEYETGSVYFEERASRAFAEGTTDIGDDVVAGYHAVLYQRGETFEEVLPRGRHLVLVEGDDTVGKGQLTHRALAVTDGQDGVLSAIGSQVAGRAAGIAVGNDGFYAEYLGRLYGVLGQERGGIDDFAFDIDLYVVVGQPW